MSAHRSPTDCVVCGAVGPRPYFCDAHVEAWSGSPEQAAILACAEAIAPIANDASRPHLGRALDAVISGAHAAFADRIRSARRESPEAA